MMMKRYSRAPRPILLNGIEEFISKSDLLDRTTILYLPSIGTSKRRTEEEFWKKFEAARPRILGVLLDIISAVLRNLPQVNLPKLPRMADTVRWVTAAESELGWQPCSFLADFNRNRASANELAIESSPIAQAILKFMSDRDEWGGTASELLEELSGGPYGGFVDRGRDWPRTPTALSKKLAAVTANPRNPEGSCLAAWVWRRLRASGRDTD
jgi:hypothetical protein